MIRQDVKIDEIWFSQYIEEDGRATSIISAYQNTEDFRNRIKQVLRVAYNNSFITDNGIDACTSLAQEIGLEKFYNSNLVKYIQASVNITNVTMPDFQWPVIQKMVKASIAYSFLIYANDEESLRKRKEDIKLYFS